MKIHEYLFIDNSGIYQFKSIDNDNFIKYYSPTGNSNVIYPYLIGDKYTYLMIEKVYISNINLKTKDPYVQYYDFNKKYKKSHFKKFNMRKNMFQNKNSHFHKHTYK